MFLSAFFFSAAGEAPVDLLLLMACSENDTPKVEEVLAAGADPSRRDLHGKTPLELCTKDEIKELVQRALAERAASSPTDSN